MRAGMLPLLILIYLRFIFLHFLPACYYSSSKTHRWSKLRHELAIRSLPFILQHAHDAELVCHALADAILACAVTLQHDETLPTPTSIVLTLCDACFALQQPEQPSSS